jgi:uncharacterized protein (TIGR02646 family)
MPFRRQPAPLFWAMKEAQWAKHAPDEWPRLDPLRLEHEGRRLRAWFHEICREDSDLQLCAYCDGTIKLTSRETVDHFAPRVAFQALSLAWHNLFPACDLCNSTYKGEQWSCALVRPDTDPVDEWFEFDQISGAMRANAAIDDPIVRARVRLTIRVLRLNTADRCRARLHVMKNTQNAVKRDAMTGTRDRPHARELAARGPYRFVAERVLDAIPASTPDPATHAP